MAVMCLSRLKSRVVCAADEEETPTEKKVLGLSKKESLVRRCVS